MPNLRPLSPCILKKMPGNFKFDQLHLVKVVPESGKSTDRSQNLTSSEGGGDTSACPGHSHYAFSRNVLKPLRTDRWTESRLVHSWSSGQRDGWVEGQTDRWPIQNHNASSA